MSSLNPILTWHSIDALLNAKRTGWQEVVITLDLGLTQITALVSSRRVTLPNGQWLHWETLENHAGNPNGCYALVDNNSLKKIQLFSTELNRLYTLMPVMDREKSTAPTMLISGIPMHRIKKTNPWRDTKEKTRAAGPFTGAVLDTATGLGYTAIAAAQTANHVITIELDPTVHEICRANPWSQRLFEPEKITRLIGDTDDLIREMDDESFTQIIHDPPMFSLAGHLYSASFYHQLYRVLKKRGKVFHYIGNPKSKSGRSVTNSVIQRFQDVGFTRIQHRPRAFGIVAQKV